MSKPDFPPPPPNIAPYVEVLGVDGTVEFLLEFGGGYLFFTANNTLSSELVEYLGPEKAFELGNATGQIKGRIPIAKRWIAKVLKAKGLPTTRIARRLHTTDVTVRKYLKDEYTPPSKLSGQLDLF